MRALLLPHEKPQAIAEDAQEGCLPSEDLARELSVLQAAREMLRSIPNMSKSSRTELLSLMHAVLSLPSTVALRHDASWREALDAMCEAASASSVSKGGDEPLDMAAPMPPRASAEPSPSRALAPLPASETAAVAGIAMPMLTDAVRSALTEWAVQSSDEIEGRTARAEQLSVMLLRVSALRLRSDVAGDADAGAMARALPCAHLVELAPALINAIGRPTHIDGGAVPGREAQALQAAIREALQLVASSLNL
eukprot:scaffold186388_cov29-Tisochrysis_lutea.AAC.1